MIYSYMVIYNLNGTPCVFIFIFYKLQMTELIEYYISAVSND